jgi:excisionase family DNA binding protein
MNLTGRANWRHAWLPETQEAIRAVVAEDLAQFKQTAQWAHSRAESAIEAEVRRSATALREELQSDVNTARLRAAEIVQEVKETFEKPRLNNHGPGSHSHPRVRHLYRPTQRPIAASQTNGDPMGTATISTSAREELPLTVRDAATYLGVSPQTVYLWVERKQIPHLRVMGRNIRFLRSELEPFRATFKQEVVEWQDQ